MKHPLLILLAASSLVTLGCSLSHEPVAASPSGEMDPMGAGSATVSRTDAIPELHRLTDDLYSGGYPDGEPAYDELAALGVKTVISVDGTPPDRDLAARYGIRVAHLPFGYDGVSDERAKELSHAIATLPRPIFVNCHHGNHRGPVGLCVGAIGSGDITHEQALAHMRLAKTSPKYKGLWEAVETMAPQPQSVLHDDSLPLPEKWEVGDFVDAMNAIDEINEQLQLCADNNFQPLTDHPDLAPLSLAGQIHDHFRSLENDEHTLKAGPDFKHKLLTARDHARDLELRLDAGDLVGALESLDALSNSCNDCHTKYRNNI